MGCRTKQVSSDAGSDWTPSLMQDQRLLPMKRQHQQHQSTTTVSSEQAKCPRCRSTNTKFCYYNNYNKSQPRHYCKACKRHWTKGGTLRNVPMGGSRKNKRPRRKTSPSATVTNTNSATPITVSDTSLATDRIDQQKHKQVICPQPSLLLQPTFHDTTSAADRSVLHDLDDQFPWSCSSPFEVSSWQNPILTGTVTVPMSFGCHQPWTFSSNVPETAGNNMNSDELDKLVSANLNFPWDDIDIKLP